MLPSCEVIRKHMTVTEVINEFLRLKNVKVHYRVHKSIGEPVQLSMSSIKPSSIVILKRKRPLSYSKYAMSFTELEGSLP